MYFPALPGIPSQHTASGHHQPAGETPFLWRFAGPLMVDCYFVFVGRTYPYTGMNSYLRYFLPIHKSHLLFYEKRYIPDKKRNAPGRTVQISGRSQVVGQFNFYWCKGMSGTAALHIFCNQASKMCKRKLGMNQVGVKL